MTQEVNLWTTIPQVASTLIASLSLLAAIYIILRDRRARRREEAERVICWLDIKRIYTINKSEGQEVATADITTMEAKVLVRSESRYPILNPGALSRPMTKRELKSYGRSVQGRRYEGDRTKRYVLASGGLRLSDGTSVGKSLPSGSECEFMQEKRGDDLIDAEFWRYWVVFTDHAGNRWLRDAATAKLLSLESRAALRDVRGRRRWMQGQGELMLRMAVGVDPGASERALLDIRSRLEQKSSAKQRRKPR